MPVIHVTCTRRPSGSGMRHVWCWFQRTRARAFGFLGASKRARNCSGNAGARVRTITASGSYSMRIRARAIYYTCNIRILLHEPGPAPASWSRASGELGASGNHWPAARSCWIWPYPTGRGLFLCRTVRIQALLSDPCICFYHADANTPSLSHPRT